MNDWLDAGSLDADAIKRLVENRCSEGERLDFKLRAAIASDGEKDEFLKDVTAMANRSGGTILIGIEDRDDEAVDAPGIEAAEARSFEEKATNLLRDKVEPPVWVRFDTISVADRRVVLAVTVSPSFHPPHAVVSKGRRIIWRRAGKANNPATVAEIREMVMAGATLNARLKAFHDERVAVLEQGGDGRAAPFRAGDGYVLAHLIPLRFFEDRRDALDVFALVSDRQANLLQDMFRNSQSSRGAKLDHHGWIQYGDNWDHNIRDQYLRFFNSGIAEAAQGRVITSSDEGEPSQIFWPGPGNFRRLTAYLDFVTEFIRNKGVDAPYAGIVTIGRLNRAFVDCESSRYRRASDDQNGRILDDKVSYGPVMLGETAQRPSWAVLVDGIMDRIWQAAGRTDRPSLVR